MDLTANLAYGAISFARHTVGIATKPYETYRQLVSSGSLWELPFIGIVVGIYFAFATLVKGEAFRIFLLTKQFILLFSAAAITYGVVAGLLWYVGRYVGGAGSVRGLILGWAYTLIPTVCWFLVTSLLFIILPPPRTTSPLGILFSLVYLVFSGSIFLWKVVLAYLTLRFGHKLDLAKSIKTAVVVLPMIALYSFGMYQLGIFRIPFL